VGRAHGIYGRGEKKSTRFWRESQKERGQLEDRGVNGIRMHLREIGLGGGGVDSTGSGEGPVAGSCKCGDEPSGSSAMELAISSED
jgi:hypothetical protein